MHPDGERIEPRRFEGHLPETGLAEPTANARGEVRLPPTASPHDNALRRTEPRKQAHRRLDVLVGDIAEDAAHEHQVGGNSTDVRIRHRSVGHDDLDLVKTGSSGRRARYLRIARVELDQSCSDVIAARMTSQNSE